MNVLTVSGLSKTYASGFNALKNVDLEIRRGEIFALLGPNGAGKTTLINIVCGIVTASTGSVSADGHDIVRDFRAARAKIGLVPQELTTDMFETVWNTLTFSRGLFGKARNPAVIEKVLRDLSLWDKKDAKIMALSGGMKRRVMIGKALSHEPRFSFSMSRRRESMSSCVATCGDGAGTAREWRHHHPHHALHRGSRGDGRSDRRHPQGRAHSRRGKDRAHAQAR
jgi:ABC-type lipopolysaccharide export system ATPase subunit